MTNRQRSDGFHLTLCPQPQALATIILNDRILINGYSGVLMAQAQLCTLQRITIRQQTQSEFTIGPKTVTLAGIMSLSRRGITAHGTPQDRTEKNG